MLKLQTKHHPHHFQNFPVEKLLFRPARGFASPHLQTILPSLLSKAGVEPPSNPCFIYLEDGDALCCKMSTPLSWLPHEKTILMLHGLGGSDASTYMVRMSRKFYQAGYRILRINLRGSGQGIHFAKKPYNGGISHDILQVIQTLKKDTPESPIILIGFSIGGNIALKLMGELEHNAPSFIEMAIAICPPIDLAQTMELLLDRSNRLYHLYYVRGLQRLGSRWIGENSIQSIIDFDNLVTATHWGYCDAYDYYHQCSSKFFLPSIRQTCHLIFAADDPFVDYCSAMQQPLSTAVKIWLSPQGGHMGFWGWAGKEHGYNWLDALLLKLVHPQPIN